MPNQRDKYSKRGKWWLPPHTVHVVRHYCYSYKMYKDEYMTLKDSIGINAVNYDGMPSGNFRTGSSTENYAIRLAEVAKNIEIIEETVKEVCEQDKCSNIESNLLRYITHKSCSYFSNHGKTRRCSPFACISVGYFKPRKRMSGEAAYFDAMSDYVETWIERMRERKRKREKNEA